MIVIGNVNPFFYTNHYELGKELVEVLSEAGLPLAPAESKGNHSFHIDRGTLTGYAALQLSTAYRSAV